jgi:hypothetical protein
MLAPELVQQFRRDGAVKLESFLDEETLARCRADFEYCPGLLTQGVPGVPQDPFAPRRGPLGPFPDRERAIGNAPALVPEAPRLDCKTYSRSPRYHPRYCLANPSANGRGLGEVHSYNDLLSLFDGVARVIPDCHFAVQLNHFIPDFLSYSAAVSPK